MSRYIDANSLYQKINDWRNQIKTTCGERDDYVECLGEVLTFIGSEPNADVVEVVRCRDCIFWDHESPAAIAGMCRVIRELMPREHFCAYGKRKEKTDER